MTKATHKKIKLFVKSRYFHYWLLFNKYRSAVFGISKEKKFDVGSLAASKMKSDVVEKVLASKSYKFYLILKPVLCFVSSNISSIKRWIPQIVKNEVRFYFHFIKNVLGATGAGSEFERLKQLNASQIILVMPPIDFNWRIQRPQQLSRQFAKKGDIVVYFSIGFVYRSFLQKKSDNYRLVKLEKNLYEIKLSSTKQYFIYNQQLRKKDIQDLKVSILHFLKSCKTQHFLIICGHPFWLDLVKELDLPFIFDFMDDYAYFKESGAWVEKKEREAIEISQAVLASSKALYEKAKKYRKNVELVRNAATVEMFSLEFDTKPMRRIGYIGAISEWMDHELIADIAYNFPDYEIVLAGRVANKHIDALATKYPNIQLLGEVPHHEVPKLLATFQVCLIPFLLTPLIEATDPVKIYEYFALGKPVVTTALPELSRYKDLLYFAKNNRQFIQKINIAMNENSSKKKLSRMNEAKQNTWSGRYLQIQNIIDTQIYPRLSVVVLAFNQAKMTIRCIKSILAAGYPLIEIIVVDNSSIVADQEEIESFCRSINSTYIRNSLNTSFAQGNNLGIKKATGEYILLLNNDTLLTKGSLSRIVYHTSKKGVGLVGPVTNNIGNEAKIHINYPDFRQASINSEAHKYTYKNWGKSLNVQRIAAFCWCFPKQVLKDVGFLDERFIPYYFEDDDYCDRVRNKGYHILIAEDSFVHHELSASINSSNTDKQKIFQKNKELYEKKWKRRWKPHKYR